MTEKETNDIQMTAEQILVAMEVMDNGERRTDKIIRGTIS